MPTVWILRLWSADWLNPGDFTCDSPETVPLKSLYLWSGNELQIFFSKLFVVVKVHFFPFVWYLLSLPVDSLSAVDFLSRSVIPMIYSPGQEIQKSYLHTNKTAVSHVGSSSFEFELYHAIHWFLARGGPIVTYCSDLYSNFVLSEPLCSNHC